MGEVTDDMIEGLCCAICGQYFEDPNDGSLPYSHGYPVACEECYEEDCGYQRATVNTIG